jgi:glycosyltransferase involved in cell wall biosynthesis
MLLPSLPRAGMEVMAASLGRGLAERGHEVGFTCIAGPGQLGEELRDHGFRVSVVAAPGLRPNLFPAELGPWLRRLQPDIVHIHSGIWLKGAQAARHALVPRVVYTLHGILVVEPWHSRVLSWLAARRTDHIVAVSESLGRYLRAAVGAAAGKVHVIPNGVSTRRYAPGPRSPELRRALGIPDGACVVGNVARLQPEKNHELLLEAFGRLRRQHPLAFLLLVGDGNCRSHLEEKIDSLGMREHVRITGTVSDTAPIYNELDLFVLSSAIEGTSMSILEAMASGVPVVATAVGGTPELLGEGAFGVLVPAGEPAALAAAMANALADPAGTRTRSRAARERVFANYSEARMIQDYERVFLAGHLEPRDRSVESHVG